MADNNELEKWKLAGKIAAQALQHGLPLIRKGNSALHVVEEVDRKIIELGAKPAFPAQVSMNDVAAHFCPDSGDKTVFDSQIVKLDVGVSVDGFIGDTASTVDLSGDHSELMKASKDALEAAIRVSTTGTTLRELGKAIQQAITGYGFSPIVNLSGHGLGRFEVHTPPTVPNYDNADETKLYDGQIIAIEPFATNGAGAIYESSNPTVFMQVASKPVRSADTRKILEEIHSYRNMPFTGRWLEKKFPAFKVSIAMRELAAAGILHAFPPLVEKKHGLVTQFEHTVLVGEKPKVLTSEY